MILERKFVFKKFENGGNYFFNEVFNLIKGFWIRMKILKIFDMLI